MISTLAHSFQRFLLGKIAELGVTNSQKQQIYAILREARSAIQALVAQYLQERRTLRKAIHTAPLNEQAIRAQAASRASRGRSRRKMGACFGADPDGAYPGASGETETAR